MYEYDNYFGSNPYQKPNAMPMQSEPCPNGLNRVEPAPFSTYGNTPSNNYMRTRLHANVSNAYEQHAI